MAFTFTCLDVIVVLDLKKNIGRSTDLAKKRHRLADLHTPIQPPPISQGMMAPTQGLCGKYFIQFKGNFQGCEF